MEQRRELGRIVTTSPSRQLKRRARILILRADGWTRNQIAVELGINLAVVRLWERRFASSGLAGLANARGQGAKPKIPSEKINLLLKLTAEPAPPPAYRWTVKLMAHQTGLAPSNVQRLWAAHGIRPHLRQRIRHSFPMPTPSDICEVVGLFLHPPHRTLAVCSDGRRFEGGPELFGPAWVASTRRSFVMSTEGVTTGMVRLLAALSYLDCKIAGTTAAAESCGGWLRFHEKLCRQVPAWCVVHLLVDNNAIVKNPRVRAWIKERPRVRLRVAPVGFSWLHSLESFFRRVVFSIGKDVSFRGGSALADEIINHLLRHDLKPPAYTWHLDLPSWECCVRRSA